MSATPSTDTSSGGSANGGGGGGGGGNAVDLRLPLKQPPPPPHSVRAVSPPSPMLQQMSPLPSPRSSRERVRRSGHSPLAVVINPPSLDDDELSTAAASVTGKCGSSSAIDSLSLALEELRASGGTASVAVFTLPPQPKVDDIRSDNATPPVFKTSAATVAAAVVTSELRTNGLGYHSSSGGSLVGSRSDDDFLSVRPLAKRSSSLKSKKTPPGTPCQAKKAVRFADAFGLDLANVKHVLDPDNPPEIPPHATRDLELSNEDAGNLPSEPLSLSASLPTISNVPGPQPPANDVDKVSRFLSSAALYTARPAFSQPGHSAGFGARVVAQKVVLESATFAPASAEVRGYVRVANIAFHKAVAVRFTFDAWRNSSEVSAAYVPDSSSGMTDQFAFTLSVPTHHLRQPGIARIAFCVSYSVEGQTFWDNNFGENYAFDCVPAMIASTGTAGTGC